MTSVVLLPIELEALPWRATADLPGLLCSSKIDLFVASLLEGIWKASWWAKVRPTHAHVMLLLKLSSCTGASMRAVSVHGKVQAECGRLACQSGAEEVAN